MATSAVMTAITTTIVIVMNPYRLDPQSSHRPPKTPFSLGAELEEIWWESSLFSASVSPICTTGQAGAGVSQWRTPTGPVKWQ